MKKTKVIKGSNLPLGGSGISYFLLWYLVWDKFPYEWVRTLIVIWVIFRIVLWVFSLFAYEHVDIFEEKP